MKANQKIVAEFRRDSAAVSPIVATLMLVLVAAGAAVGLNVWMKNFQGKSTEGVSSPKDVQELRIAGSSTVFEFTKNALVGTKAGTFAGSQNVAGFEEFMKSAGHPVKVDNQEGGSTAGRKAVGLCLVDIGASSSDIKPEESAIYPDCNKDGVKDFGQEMKGFQIGYDTVVPAIGASNTHCTALAFTKAQFAELYNQNGWTGTTSPVAPTTAILAVAPAAGYKYTWDDLKNSQPADAAGDKMCTGAGGPAVVVLSSRLDNSGTEDGFCEKVLGLKTDGKSCDATSDQLLANNVHAQDGNQGISTWLTSNTADLGKTDGLSFIGGGFVPGADKLVAGCLSASATGNCITAKSSTVKDGTFPVIRNLWFYTPGEPSAVAKLFLDYVTSPNNNLQFCLASGYISYY